jgi:hypothetical protein
VGSRAGLDAVKKEKSLSCAVNLTFLASSIAKRPTSITQHIRNVPNGVLFSSLSFLKPGL